ncbi:MAG TPA: hypothetical protein PK573_08490 [Spirochaetota bacterium]|nr:hypothetical protein [Spirochaetota bacterium]HRZ27434.1 hypothetical protein [Spirochaetota bacterium]HSA16595.1 hypothetical protein [Spirochaetota bacterium]
MQKDSLYNKAQAMTIPKSIIVKTVRDAIENPSEVSINDLAEVIYSGMHAQALMSSHIEDNSRAIEEQAGIMKNLIDSMHEGFTRMDIRFNDLLHQSDRRFEQVDKRFEQVDKRFEQVDKRIEQIDKRIEQMDGRIELMDKRFDGIFHQMDKRFEQTERRFEQVDRRFNRITALLTAGFAMVTVLITIYKFIQ